jgi:hypothetical protein
MPTRPPAYITLEFTRDGERYRAYDANGNQLLRATSNRDALATQLGQLGYNPIDEF